VTFVSSDTRPKITSWDKRRIAIGASLWVVGSVKQVEAAIRDLGLKSPRIDFDFDNFGYSPHGVARGGEQFGLPIGIAVAGRTVAPGFVFVEEAEFGSEPRPVSSISIQAELRTAKIAFLRPVRGALDSLFDQLRVQFPEGAGLIS
jgi:hypothetical protein